MRLSAFLTLLLLGSSCSHAQLQAKGSEVVLAREPLPSGCEKISTLVGKSLGSVFFGDSLASTALNDLRNKAGNAGATHVVERRRDPSAHACFVRGDAYRCPKPTDAPVDAVPVAPPAAPPAPESNTTPSGDNALPPAVPMP